MKMCFTIRNFFGMESMVGGGLLWAGEEVAMRHTVEDIVLLLSDEGAMAPEACARALNVTTRTVRTYVSRVNKQLEGIAHIELAHGVYCLVIDDRRQFSVWLVKAREPMRGVFSRDVPNRVYYLLNDLLARTGWITIDALAGMLYVSSRTISHELKGVEKVLQTYGLALEKRPHYGIRVTGDEMDRRTCLASIALQWLEDSGSAHGMQRYEDFSATPMVGGELDLPVIARCVDRVLGACNFQVASISYQNLLVHIAVALLRIREGHYVPMRRESLAHIESTDAYDVAKKVAAEVDHEFKVKLPPEEVGYIAIHLEGKRLLDNGNDSGSSPVISDAIWEIVTEMLDRVNDAFHFDFRSDLELRVNLAKHTAPLMVRLKYDMALKNPLLDDIFARLPLAYAMASECATVLTERTGVVPSEDEIGYIALSFALAIERKHADMPKKNIVIVCASGAGSSRLLEYRCRQEFGSYLGEVCTCNVSQVPDLDYSHIDYVFTTVPLPDSIPVPVREVSVFLDTNDIALARETLRNSRESTRLLDYFSRDLFVADASFASKDEAIRRLCSMVATKDGVDDDLAVLVREREQMAPTAFGNAIAMPHPMHAVGRTTRVCVAVLKQPISWSDDQSARLIFLISPARDAGLSLQGFFEAMADLLTDKEAMQLLMRDPAYQTLVDCVEHREKGRNR